jgi:preprotein translocase subunit SecY
VKKLIQTFKNIWSIDELKNKILFTLLLVGIYRIGSHIVLPGIDATSIKTGGSSNGLLGLIDSFSGGAFNNASIFALGIMPYISASIFMQLVTVLVPTFQNAKGR